MKVFVTGATGYIGGSVAHRLLQEGHSIVGLVRSETAAGEARALGMQPVVGTLDDATLLTDNARACDAVINTAEANHPASVEAFLAALKGSGKTFIHTSGSGIVGDFSKGEGGGKVFTEDTPIDVPPNMKVRAAIDESILNAARDSVRTIVIRPSLIYGASHGVHRESFQVPVLIEQAKKSGVPCYVGRGLNVWSNVHMDDLVDLYLLALEKAPAGSLYYAAHGEASMHEVVTAIGKMLGLSAAPEGWPLERGVEEWGPRTYVALASNSRVRSDKAQRELGWQPHGPSLFEEIGTGYYRKLHNPSSM